MWPKVLQYRKTFARSLMSSIVMKISLSKEPMQKPCWQKSLSVERPLLVLSYPVQWWRSRSPKNQCNNPAAKSPSVPPVCLEPPSSNCISDCNTTISFCHQLSSVILPISGSVLFNQPPPPSPWISAEHVKTTLVLNVSRLVMLLPIVLQLELLFAL